MNIAILGPSGAGKGTHANELVAKFDLIPLVTGELLRENVEARTAVGILSKQYIVQGELVPDEIVDAMVEAWLWRADPQKDILFDGFPRTIYQAKYLDRLLAELGRRLEAVVYLDVSDETILTRVSGRIICHDCQTPYHLAFKPPAQAGLCDLCGGKLYRRPDDIPEIVRVRLRAFHRVTGPLIAYYQTQGKLLIIDGEDQIDRVSQVIIAAMEAVERGAARFATPQDVERIEALKGIVLPSVRVRAGLNIVLFGGPGSGKGTQAEQLSREFELKHISTGDLFRENLKKQTDLGKLAKTFMDRGELVSDDITEAMVEERLARPDTATGIILDGFPRTLAQAEALTEIMAHLNRQIDGVLYLKVSDAEIVRRLSGRLICRNCQTPFHKEFNPPSQAGICDVCGGELYQRDDDNPETIRARLKTFHRQTAPLINYYREAGLLIEIDGEGDVSQVSQRMSEALRR